MFQVLGGPKRLCSGVTRRDLLSVGGLGLLGVGNALLTQHAHAELAALEPATPATVPTGY